MLVFQSVSISTSLTPLVITKRHDIYPGTRRRESGHDRIAAFVLRGWNEQFSATAATTAAFISSGLLSLRRGYDGYPATGRGAAVPERSSNSCERIYGDSELEFFGITNRNLNYASRSLLHHGVSLCAVGVVPIGCGANSAGREHNGNSYRNEWRTHAYGEIFSCGFTGCALSNPGLPCHDFHDPRIDGHRSDIRNR